MSDNSGKQQRKLRMRAPATAGSFASAAGIQVEDVIGDLKSMGIFAHSDYILPEEVIKAVASKHGVLVEIYPPSPFG